MSNVISIFTKEEPCQNLRMPDEDFRQFISKNWTGTHLWDCQDCIARYTTKNRYVLGEALAKQMEVNSEL